MQIDPIEGRVLINYSSVICSASNVLSESKECVIKTCYFLGRYMIVSVQTICLDSGQQRTKYELYRSPNMIYGIKTDIDSYTVNETERISEICKYGTEIDKLHNALSWLKLQHSMDFKKLS